MEISQPLVSTSTLLEFFDSLFVYFDDVFEAAPFSVERKIAGERFDCRFYDNHYAELAETALSDANQSATEGRCSILVAHAGVENVPLPPVWSEQEFREREIEAKFSSSRYRFHYFHPKSFWQIYDRDTQRGVQLMLRPDLYPDWDPGSPLRNFLHWHFAAKGMALIHSGTLAEEGIGVLLAGAGGSGKSGTVIAGLMQGMQSVGDDYVLAECGEQVRAHALLTTLKQDPDGYSRLSLADRLPNDIPLNWQGKHQFNLADVSDIDQQASIEIKALCLPKVVGAEMTTIRPASRKEAFLSLAPSGVTQMPGDRDIGFAFCGELIRRLPCYVIELGCDPVEVIATLKAHIGTLN
ncbi:hypothetical protein BOW53_14550 [Solemya pervernicosa gill symbiont]|uniref:Serine kinase n=2 Tax=Gammaproteobacteria incertae sedis TaxID=118884 RepID=A0A1T2L0Y5_9GAMM|nr:hypothetical protein [Candidatus Reidiella endopervernicosa]OOZ38738.1 hypothetical protein BOW53_14550 [Solemya pervernicosa gill symbiont]QKQ25857.1 serine kinase [Candidatus Reidiella endopervernicosa]